MFFSSFKAGDPEIELIIDLEKSKKISLDLSDLNLALQTFLGGFYINDFTLYNRIFKIFAQSEGHFCDDIDKLSQYHMKNQQGMIIPLSSLLSNKESNGRTVIPLLQFRALGRDQ
ncbi:MAG: efflux RND transporter permease subunit [Flavobacteriales bacterium AspAUS03]